MVGSACFSITIPARFEELDGLRTAFRGWLRSAGIGGRDAEELVLAAWEVCANAIEHPLETSGDDVTLSASANGDRVRVEVQDTGHWRERSEPRENRGLGLRLVAGLMDQVAVLGGGPGTRVVMWATTGRKPHAGVPRGFVT